MAIRISANLMSTLLRFYKNLMSNLRGMTIIVSIKTVFTLFRKNMTANNLYIWSHFVK
jgi:hypothetical protein